jgi:anaerobic C4-dicarboxylate transporter
MRHSWSFKQDTQRRKMTFWQYVRACICIIGMSFLATWLLGEWVWKLESLLGSIVGFVLWIIAEVVLLAYKDDAEAMVRAEHQ